MNSRLKRFGAAFATVITAALTLTPLGAGGAVPNLPLGRRHQAERAGLRGTTGRVRTTGATCLRRGGGGAIDRPTARTCASLSSRSVIASNGGPRTKVRWRLTWAGAAIAAATVIGGSWSSTVAAGQPERRSGAEPCHTPTGVNVNERWGVSWRIIAPFCTDAVTGEHWSTTAVWLMSTSFDAVPDGFVPAGDTPLEDFRAKFVGVKYVVDPGTTQQETYVFDNVDQLALLQIEDVQVVNTLALATLHPLSDGDHVVQTFWVFNAMHCDGIAAVVADNCLPAGETLYHEVTFAVSPPTTGP